MRLLLEKIGDRIGHDQHENAGGDDCRGHDDEVLRQGNGRQNGIEGKDDVHDEDPEKGGCDRPLGRGGVSLAEFFRGEHVVDLLHRGVDEKAAAEKHDERMAAEFAVEEGDGKGEKRLLEDLDQLEDDEEQHDAQADREHGADPPT